MIHFSDYNHELYKISMESPYNLQEIRNYYDDVAVLGELATYNKYKDKIEQIIEVGTKNRELQIIPSVYSERFDLEVLPQLYKGNLKDICDIFNKLETTIENKNLRKEGKVQIYNNVLEGFELNNTPIFRLIDRDNPELNVCLYPTLKRTSKDNDVYLSYYFQISKNDIQLIYSPSMMISYLTNPGVEDRIKKCMYLMGKRFEKDVCQFMIDAENLEDLLFQAKDNVLYENCREPLVALRENGYILEVTKEKGILMSKLYSSSDNIHKDDMLLENSLNEDFDLTRIETLEELKENCQMAIQHQLAWLEANKEEEEENEYE